MDDFRIGTTRFIFQRPMGRILTNALIDSAGAALVRILPIDSFLFICSSAAVAILGSGLAIHAYLVDRRPLPLVCLKALILVLALISAGRTPYWIINSPEVAWMVPLTVAVWFWTVRGRESDKAASLAMAVSIIGSALTKVTSAGTLTTVAFVNLLPHLRRLPRALQVVLTVLAAASAAYVSLMLIEYLPWYLRLFGTRTTGWGPRS